MRKTFIVTFVIYFLFTIFSCQKKDKVPLVKSEPSLSIGMPDGTPAPDSYYFSPEENSQSFKIVSNGQWEISIEDSGSDWLKIDPMKGDDNMNISITVEENKNRNQRTATLVFSIDGEKIKTYKIYQDGYIPEYKLSVSSDKSNGISLAGGDIVFTVHSNGYDWEYSILNTPDWLEVNKKTDSSLILTVDKNLNEPRSTKVAFTLLDTAMTYSIPVIQLGQAGMLDVEFNLDGSATDHSPMQNTVQKIIHDYPFNISYNDTYGRNMVTFSPEENGVSPASGHGSWYQIDYKNNTDFQDKLADGHSFECLVQFDDDYTVDVNHETKFFSTTESGGTGFLITKDNNSTGINALAFIPNVPSTKGGGSTWRWANSNVRPQPDIWYHVVGVWDKDNGKASIYVNGEKKNEVDASGYYRPSPYEDAKWVAIGGDPGKTGNIQLPFAGKILMARIYDEPLTKEEVDALWNQVNPGN